MIYFWIVVYNVFIVPLAVIGFYLMGIFNMKIREGIKGRLRSKKELLNFVRSRRNRRELFIVHSASLGEFEQAKPVIRGLKALRPDILIVASFTSPSGYKNAERMEEVDLYTYLPLDVFFWVKVFLQKLKPAKIVFVSYELWPNLLFLARRYRISTYIISARLRNADFKSRPIVRSIVRGLYELVDNIYTVSETDEHAFKKRLGINKVEVLTLGDTRYDQVLQRAKEHIKFRVKRVFDEGFAFIAGSVWPQDVRHLLPALKRAMERFEDLKIIIAPHEPTQYAIEALRDYFEQYGYQVDLYSKLSEVSSRRVVVVDVVGILAELYHQSRIAFVGGSFRGSVHNVMEPAVAGNPVVVGPYYKNSREAELLIEEGGAFPCRDREEIFEILVHLKEDEKFYREASEASRRVIVRNLGASARTVKEILGLS